MYYLQSRYYDSAIYRFINADGYVSTGQGILGNNMFAYCNNNPVMWCDPIGDLPMPFWELIWPGEIHREVQEYLRDNYGYVLEVAIDGKRIDLVKGNQAYEIKPFTTPKPLAVLQLSNYISISNGKYVVGKYSPELTGKFISKRGYTVKFYYMGDGIIQYSFYRESSPAVYPGVAPKTNGNKSSAGNALIVSGSAVGVSLAIGFVGFGGLVPPCKEMLLATASIY